MLFALALLGAVGPLGIDMFLPGLEELRTDLGTTPAAAQLTISGFMVGMAVGNLLCGAISDSTGRKPPILIASAVLFVASVACAVAPSISILIAARVVQGLAGGCIIVVSRALVPDLLQGREAARAYSALLALTGFMPAVAPVLGAALMPFVGWRGVFWALALANLLQLVVAWRLPETLPPERRSRGTLSTLFPRIARCLRRPGFVGYMAAGALGFGALFAYIAASPLVLQAQLGYSPTAYALIFGGIALLLPLSNTINMRVVQRVHPRRALIAGLLIDASAATALIIIALTNPSAAMVPLLAVLAMMSGFISANASALAVEEIRDIGAGAGSGAMGFAQFLTAGVVPAVVGLGANHALSMAVTSLACAGVAALMVSTLSKPGTMA